MSEKLRGTFTCYRCGQKFDNSLKRRARVQTGSSYGWSLRSYRAYYRTVNLCPNCYEEEMEARRLGWLTIGLILLIGLLVIAIRSLLSP